MRTIRPCTHLVALLILMCSSGYASDYSIAELLKAGYAHEEKHEYARALQNYQSVLRSNPDHTEALWRSSKMMNYLGGLSRDRTTKHASFIKARDLAQRAIRQDAFCKEAHLNYIIALGLLSELADSPKEKLSNARIIKKEADLLLQLDSLYAPAYFVLGKWNYVIASLNWIERTAFNLLFGGLPEGASFSESERCFDKAIGLEPNQIRFYYSIASLHHHQGNYALAVEALDKALTLTPSEPDDHVRVEKCKQLLLESKKNLRKT